MRTDCTEEGACRKSAGPPQASSKSFDHGETNALASESCSERGNRLVITGHVSHDLRLRILVSRAANVANSSEPRPGHAAAAQHAPAARSHGEHYRRSHHSRAGRLDYRFLVLHQCDFP